MEKALLPYQHLKIQLEEITSATNNFDEQNCIGFGGFGKVYKGELSHSKGRSMVAIKRKHGQGIPEFLKEIMMLSDYRHENLISLLGFCCEGSEMILVYELASRGSLNRHLNSPLLTWTQRLKICLDAAKGLSYLHDPRETHQRLIHCDIKSANILLDDQWNAKVSDFGLSIMGPANEQHSIVVTRAAGTRGYVDPQYAMTDTLTKESDVYSFGVVLFEVLCGKLCITYNRNGDVVNRFVPTWIESYKQKKLNDIIFKSPPIQPMDQSALETFSDIAYRCLNESREDRPTMDEVVTELETALQCQEFCEKKTTFDYEEMAKTVEPPLQYSSKGELWRILSKGGLLNNGKTWFSLNKKGEHCEMISFAQCLDSELASKWSFDYNSRFAVGSYHYENESVETRVKPQFLSPLITYTVNLVFKLVHPFAWPGHYHIFLKYKLQGETKTSISYLADEREDGWLICELYQFTSDHQIVDLKILFEGFFNKYTSIQVEGIEFRPLEKSLPYGLYSNLQVEHKDEHQRVSDSDANWEEKLPSDYEDIMRTSKNRVRWTTKKEAYSVLCKGFFINNGTGWFSLDKNGKKCHMLSARATCVQKDTRQCWLSLPKSRFGEAVQFGSWPMLIISNIQSKLVSSETTYGAYLVYKFSDVESRVKAPFSVCGGKYFGSERRSWYLYLVSPQTPVIGPNADQNTHNAVNRPNIKGLPQQRNDDWMEVEIWQFRIRTTTTTPQLIPLRLSLSNCDGGISGLIIEGIEFRPI
ncbi:hypothetical protein SSX86_011948 [Deinandra increscens subsp. villosa]|uniref:Protein kinase domain-containing protein n=1 Tax=Deinandra increscens subsp. villosa TaxID=3103831 RepID=A0AAP0D7S3_9ASTR